jgi:alginate O-acetyltransferase complex protein AlgI
MALAEPLYLLFLSGVVLAFYLLQNGRARLLLLLVAGYTFYWLLSPRSAFVLVLVTVMVAAYAGSRLLAATRETRVDFPILILILVALLIPLICFKYTGLIVDAVLTVSGRPSQGADDWIAAHVLLPIGVSFFVFQAIGYVVDIYLGVMQEETSLPRFALFMAFFPIVTAGPIERGHRLLPQLNLNARFEAQRTLDALRLILFGLTLKLVIADSLALPVNTVFASISKYGPLDQVLASIFFSFQIYADVAGYSLIAVGSALLLGIDVMMNFQQPFLAENIQEFWRCWHISLSTWLRDYLFMPMRTHWRAWPRTGTVAALVLTFLIAGIWHGAGWTFILYGLSQGILLSISALTFDRRTALWRRIGVPLPIVKPFRIVVTFLTVTLTLVFVRAGSVAEAWTIIRSFFSPETYHQMGVELVGLWQPGIAARPRIFLFWDWILIALLMGSDIVARARLSFAASPRIFQAFIFGLCGAGILYHWVVAEAPQPFIYYKF